jgi:hypothetical protein
VFHKPGNRVKEAARALALAPAWSSVCANAIPIDEGCGVQPDVAISQQESVEVCGICGFKVLPGSY